MNSTAPPYRIHVLREPKMGLAWARSAWLSPLALFLFLHAASAADTWTIGLTESGVPIEATLVEGPGDSAPRVLLIGGLAGRDETVDIVAREAEAFEATPTARRPFGLLAIPDSNPHGHALDFPPSGEAYRENIESHVLWRWIGVHAPDLVVIVGENDFGLAEALESNVVAGVGSIPTRRVDPTSGVLESLPGTIPASEARLEIEARRSRSPRQLAEELAEVYGHDLDRLSYIPALAMIARLRLGATEDVGRLAEPYLDGSVEALARPSGGALAGHLLFAELARRTGDTRAADLVRRAADIGFTESGEMLDFMPSHGGWSDSVFMDIPILVRAGVLTGESRYFDMAARHFDFMQDLVLRPDGLYRHQASTDAAWGRGNAFPALGLAWALSDFPGDHPAFDRLLGAFREHMAVLAGFQDENGMWREIVDHPGAYPEFSSTAMIATAMLRGIRNEWLDAATYQPVVERAWQAILTRTRSDGLLVDVCESTGTRGLSFNDYLRRRAILDRDDRGGAMAMIFATELAGLQ
jgi:unsaturated rhamnogalacturonyl hydrolase